MPQIIYGKWRTNQSFSDLCRKWILQPLPHFVALRETSSGDPFSLTWSEELGEIISATSENLLRCRITGSSVSNLLKNVTPALAKVPRRETKLPPAECSSWKGRLLMRRKMKVLNKLSGGKWNCRHLWCVFSFNLIESWLLNYYFALF